MKYLIGFLAFWYNFIIGDDWTIAVGVVLALALGAWLARSHVSAWLWLPIAVGVVLVLSLWRAVKAPDARM